MGVVARDLATPEVGGHEPRPGPGWVRAAVETAVVVAIGLVFVVFVPNLVLTRSTWSTRGWRVACATALFFGALAALAWSLRRLQARRLPERA